MAAATALVLASLARSIIQPGLKQHHHIGRATAKQMLEREVYLHQELVHLLQEIENTTDAEEARLFSAWLFWTAAAALVLFVVICWLARRRKLQKSPQYLTVCCPDLPEDISEIEIGLAVYEHDGPRRNTFTLDLPTS